MFSLYDTMTKTMAPFSPADPRRVTMYVCGPTVYDEPHLGNARPAVIFDVLFRLLRFHYGDEAVVYASNYTDVDDKIIDRARFLGIRPDQLTPHVISDFEKNAARLNVLPPSIRPRATHNIAAMQSMIAHLIEIDHAYVAKDHVFFSVASFPQQGILSGQVSQDHQDAVRIEANPLKRDPADFVLWKPSTVDQPGWNSPWGLGRPGWHIECSAMIASHLGQTIDIHGGGVDLVFPHHEAENAQSTCFHHGEPLARKWMHNGMVTVDGRKMSKSSGNFITLSDAFVRYDPEVLRYLLLSGHYRQPIDFSWEKMDAAKATLDRWYRMLEETQDVAYDSFGSSVVAELNRDLNTANALGVMNAIVTGILGSKDDGHPSAKGDFMFGADLLGLMKRTPDQWFGRTAAPQEVHDLVAQRDRARSLKDWPASDALREKIAALGYTVEDTSKGTTWRRT